MTHDAARRTVLVDRTGVGQYAVRNVRGGTLPIGIGDDDTFTPTELLLAAIGSCTAIDVDSITARRAAPQSFEVQVDANKIRDDSGNRLTDIEVTFRIVFPNGEAGDEARKVLPDAVRRSHDRLCTVGRTVLTGSPITTHID